MNRIEYRTQELKNVGTKSYATDFTLPTSFTKLNELLIESKECLSKLEACSSFRYARLHLDTDVNESRFSSHVGDGICFLYFNTLAPNSAKRDLKSFISFYEGFVKILKSEIDWWNEEMPELSALLENKNLFYRDHKGRIRMFE
jgi:hypothetical protein